MKRTKNLHCCENNQKLYDDYYSMQAGSGLPVFVGARMQRGHGIGSVLSGLFQSALPVLKKGAAAIGKQALRTGVDFAGDLLQGKSAKEAAANRAKEAASTLLDRASSYTIPPPGRQAIKRRVPRRAVTSKRAKRRATSKRRDIFST